MPIAPPPRARRCALAIEIAAASFALAAVAVVAASGCANGGASSEVFDSGACNAPGKVCNGVCVDVQNDPDNCGACGKTCPDGKACSQGKCTIPCPTGQQACTDDAGATFCINVKNDNAHCGRCNTACPSGQFCANGACNNGCIQGQTKCTDDAGVSYCANLDTDGHNCGACGTTCGPQQVCSNKTCASECSGEQSLCTPDAGGPAYCANLQTDNANCGDCGKSCGVLESCVAGACESACSPQQTKCTPDGGQPYCANTQTDASNCGTCGKVCPNNLPVCNGGICSSASGCLNGGKNPPSACTSGTDPQTGSPWVVCQADCNSIWISCATAQGGTYHATEICNQLGYSTLSQYGGNCGKVCSYCAAGSCSSPGVKSFTSGGNCGTDQWGQKLCITVMWLCTK